MKLVTIYTISDASTGYVYYVGATVQKLEKRLRGHRQYTSAKLRQLLNREQEVIISEIDKCHFAEAANLENYWILQFRAWGFNLVNSPYPLFYSPHNKCSHSDEEHIMSMIECAKNNAKSYKRSVLLIANQMIKEIGENYNKRTYLSSDAITVESRLKRIRKIRKNIPINEIILAHKNGNIVEYLTPRLMSVAKIKEWETKRRISDLVNSNVLSVFDKEEESHMEIIDTFLIAPTITRKHWMRDIDKELSQLINK